MNHYNSKDLTINFSHEFIKLTKKLDWSAQEYHRFFAMISISYEITMQKLKIFWSCKNLFSQIKNYPQLFHFPQICNKKTNIACMVCSAKIDVQVNFIKECFKLPALPLADLPVCTFSAFHRWAHELCDGMRFFHALYEREFPPWSLQWARVSFQWPSPGRHHWPEITIHCT